jgi:GNAT superfamily N-acetyltransferase
MKLVRLSDSASPATFTTAFCSLPGRVRKEPFRTALLPASICKQLLSAAFPPRREFWLGYERGQPVGRIAANVSATRSEIGYFGLFETELEPGYAAMAMALLTEACTWLRAQGVSRIVGPVTFNTWFPYRLRLDSNDKRFFDWEPVNPPEYVHLVEAAGFQPVERYTSTAFGNLAEVIERLEPAYQRALSEGFRFLKFGEDSIRRHLPALYRISHAAFRNNYLFEPIPEALFAKTYRSIVTRGRHPMSWFVLAPPGEQVGFLYAFIDHWRDNTRTETAVVLKSAGIMPAARGRGLSNALIYLAIQDGLQRGADYAIAALVRAGMQSESYARRGTYLWQHDYGLWQKT